MMTFGDRLRSARKKTELTQKELAKKLGIGQTTIANYEQGTRFPDGETLVNLADTLSTSIDYLLGRDSAVARSSHEAIPVDDWDGIQREYLALVLEGKKNAGQDLLLGLVDGGARLEDLLERVLRPVLYTLGDLWESGAVGVETEHYVSYAVEEVLAAIQTRISPTPRNGKRLVSVVAPGEQHSLGLRMASNLLEFHGWESVFLGINVPVHSLKAAVLEWEPNLLMVSVTMETNLEAASMMIQSVRSEFSIPIILGGPIIRDRAGEHRYGADAVVSSSLEALEKANILTSPVVKAGRSES